MIADYHVHTEYSDDSDYKMEEVVQDAIAKGIQEICFTDHVDYGIKKDWEEASNIPLKRKTANVNYPEYVREIHALQKKYQDQITLKMGLEFGMQRHTIDQYEKLFHRYDFDFILLSVHQIDNQEFWTQQFQQGKTPKEVAERYYEEILYLVQNYKNYSVLAHMDLIVRYEKQGSYPFEKLKPIIQKILEIVIQDGKGIEVNTSCYAYGLKDLTPSAEILKLYHDLGGTLLTLGSDSHQPEQLGAHMQETKQKLLAMGFKHICTFDKMKPIFHSLIKKRPFK